MKSVCTLVAMCVLVAADTANVDLKIKEQLILKGNPSTLPPEEIVEESMVPAGSDNWTDEQWNTHFAEGHHDLEQIDQQMHEEGVHDDHDLDELHEDLPHDEKIKILEKKSLEMDQKIIEAEKEADAPHDPAVKDDL